jgi:hypothetical protein
MLHAPSGDPAEVACQAELLPKITMRRG